MKKLPEILPAPNRNAASVFRFGEKYYVGEDIDGWNGPTLETEAKAIKAWNRVMGAVARAKKAK